MNGFRKCLNLPNQVRTTTKNLLNLRVFQTSIEEFDNLITENQNKAKEFNIGSHKVFLEMNKDTAKYEVSRA